MPLNSGARECTTLNGALSWFGNASQSFLNFSMFICEKMDGAGGFTGLTVFWWHMQYELSLQGFLGRDLSGLCSLFRPNSRVVKTVWEGVAESDNRGRPSTPCAVIKYYNM